MLKVSTVNSGNMGEYRFARSRHKFGEYGRVPLHAKLQLLQIACRCSSCNPFGTATNQHILESKVHSRHSVSLCQAICLPFAGCNAIASLIDFNQAPQRHPLVLRLCSFHSRVRVGPTSEQSSKLGQGRGRPFEHQGTSGTRRLPCEQAGHADQSIADQSATPGWQICQIVVRRNPDHLNLCAKKEEMLPYAVFQRGVIEALGFSLHKN